MRTLMIRRLNSFARVGVRGTSLLSQPETYALRCRCKLSGFKGAIVRSDVHLFYLGAAREIRIDSGQVWITISGPMSQFAVQETSQGRW